MVERVKEQESFRYLGLNFDQRLSWDLHVEHVRKKVSMVSIMMNREKRNIPKKLKEVIYKGLIQPYFDYGASIWAGASKKTMKPLVKLQKKIVRVLVNEKYNAHTMPIFQKLKILPIENQKHLSDIRLGYRIFHSMAPPTILEDFPKAEESTRARSETVFKNAFKVPFMSLKILQTMPKYSIPYTWNREEYTQIAWMYYKEFMSMVKDNILLQIDPDNYDDDI